jgi:DNA-binding transcriptional regulator of glucitol operon
VCVCVCVCVCVGGWVQYTVFADVLGSLERGSLYH